MPATSLPERIRSSDFREKETIKRRETTRSRRMREKTEGNDDGTNEAHQINNQEVESMSENCTFHFTFFLN